MRPSKEIKLLDTYIDDMPTLFEMEVPVWALQRRTLEVLQTRI
jgi:hypothetical protein